MDQPHSITHQILALVEEIAKNLGKIEGLGLIRVAPHLRKQNKVRTIHSTLVIEGNRLTREQVTSIIEGKPVIGPRKDIIEVENAIEVYKVFTALDPMSEVSFKKAHSILMQGLLKADSGQYRKQNFGVGDHIAPAFTLVPTHMQNLFASLKKSAESLLIKSCIFHYETEFIHPFIDGNGRMGRLWQSLLLYKVDSVFASVPVENFVKDHQSEYYKVLRQCDQAGNSTLFIEFMLELINQGLKEFLPQKISLSD